MELKKTALAIGIAIILSAFIMYALGVFYEGPDYAVYSECRDQYTSEDSRYHQCWDDYQELGNKYRRNVMIITGVIAIIFIIIGLMAPSLEAIGSGLLGGGIILLLYSITYGWGIMGKYLRLGVLGTGLVILIFLGYKKVEKKKSPRHSHYSYHR